MPPHAHDTIYYSNDLNYISQTELKTLNNLKDEINIVSNAFDQLSFDQLKEIANSSYQKNNYTKPQGLELNGSVLNSLDINEENHMILVKDNSLLSNSSIELLNSSHSSRVSAQPSNICYLSYILFFI
jgi:hypothetical protein